MANEANPRAAAPAEKPNSGPGVVTADDMRTPDATGTAAAGGDPRAAAEGRPTPGVSTDAPKPDAPKVPHADPMPSTVKATQPGKEVSGNAHQEKYITTMGFVDHPRVNRDGSISNVHTPGMIQVLNPLYAQEEGIDPNAENQAEEKSPEEIRAANPAGSPMNPQGAATAVPMATAATSPTVAAAQSPSGNAPNPGQSTGKVGDVQAPAPRADAKSVPVPPAK